MATYTDDFGPTSQSVWTPYGDGTGLNKVDDITHGWVGQPLGSAGEENVYATGGGQSATGVIGNTYTLNAQLYLAGSGGDSSNTAALRLVGANGDWFEAGIYSNGFNSGYFAYSISDVVTRSTFAGVHTPDTWSDIQLDVQDDAGTLKVFHLINGSSGPGNGVAIPTTTFNVMAATARGTGSLIDNVSAVSEAFVAGSPNYHVQVPNGGANYHVQVPDGGNNYHVQVPS